MVAELNEGGKTVRVQLLFILTATYLKQSHVDHEINFIKAILNVSSLLSSYHTYTSLQHYGSYWSQVIDTCLNNGWSHSNHVQHGLCP